MAEAQRDSLPIRQLPAYVSFAPDLRRPGHVGFGPDRNQIADIGSGQRGAIGRHRPSY